jgi:metal-responsive CopG/Arc/MetJ family transcriptional regulator
MENKDKFVVFIDPDTIKRADELYERDGCKCRSDYIDRAIKFYSGYVVTNNYAEYFPETITTALESMLNDFENRMASLLFKLAVEISMTLHVTAATNEIDQEEMSRLRGMCVNEVKKLNGKVSFEDAVKKQKG